MSLWYQCVMADAVEIFATEVRRYCELIESRPDDTRLREIAGQLARLYAAGLDLPRVAASGDGVHSSVPTLDDWKGLSVGYYSVVSDPLQLIDNSVVIGDLRDDLADIYGDLKRGLLLFESGREEEATWDWRFGLRAHWGEHATNALRVLHAMIEQEPIEQFIGIS